MDDLILKRELIVPILKSADFADGSRVLGSLVDSVTFFPLFVEIGLEKVDSTRNGDFRIVRSVLNIINAHTLQSKHKVQPEVPKTFFTLLEKALKHRTAGVKKRALHCAVNIAAILYGEFRVSGRDHQRELLNEFSRIPTSYFQGQAFEKFIDSDWVWMSRWAGWKYQSTLEENIERMEEIFGSIWPGFTVNASCKRD